MGSYDVSAHHNLDKKFQVIFLNQFFMDQLARVLSSLDDNLG